MRVCVCVCVKKLGQSLSSSECLINHAFHDKYSQILNMKVSLGSDLRINIVTLKALRTHPHRCFHSLLIRALLWISTHF